MCKEAGLSERLYSVGGVLKEVKIALRLLCVSCLISLICYDSLWTRQRKKFKSLAFTVNCISSLLLTWNIKLCGEIKHSEKSM